jgi:hypothetical protein
MFVDQTKSALLPDETWRPVQGWPYLVSNHGRVARAETKQLKSLIQQRYHNGLPSFRFVMLRNKQVSRRAMLGNLVAEAFIGPCPKDCTVIYLDRNYNNNHVSNLRYGTKEEAREHHHATAP